MRTAPLLLLAAAAFAQSGPPPLTHAQLSTRAYSGSLASEIRSAQPTWFGYAVDSAGRNDNGCQSGRYLERHDGEGYVTVSNSPVFLEGAKQIAILFRVSNNAVEKVELYPLSCALDAGGLPFVWLTGVPSDASIAFLQTLRTDGALFAISQHAGTHALNALIDMARRDSSPHTREQALFWLAQRAGDRAASAITDAIVNDPNTEVKKKAVFALSQLPNEESVPKLIEVARSQRNPEVRKQAFFWLGQSHDPRALAFFQQVLLQ